MTVTKKEIITTKYSIEINDNEFHVLLRALQTARNSYQNNGSYHFDGPTIELMQTALRTES